MLQDQSKEVWSAKKHSVKRQGEKAASKLLIPIMLMFIGILIMVIVPIFTNMGI
jgi:tight adherence protein C